MHAVLLLPGPSLRWLDRLPACDLSIGVKRASLRFACDWSAFLDSPDLKRFDAKVIGPARMLTRWDYRNRYTTRPGINVEELSAWCPTRCDEFTSAAALALAGYIGATSIDVYGADFGGAGDDAPEFDGYVSPEPNYTPRRWERERAQFDGVSDFLRARGVKLCRIPSFATPTTPTA